MARLRLGVGLQCQSKVLIFRLTGIPTLLFANRRRVRIEESNAIETKRTADELYRALTNNLAGTAPIASLGSDPAYWTTTANVILRVKSEILQERLTAAN